MEKGMRLTLPAPGSSMAFVTYRLEEIACAIHDTVKKRKSAARAEGRLSTPLDAYAHFRSRAFKLLGYYIDNDFHPSFRWLLEMHGKRPQRSRGSVRGNQFHLGLLAMDAAAGQFMHPNKLRDYAVLMQQARSKNVLPAAFDTFVRLTRKDAHEGRVPVSSERGSEIRRRSMNPPQ